MKGGLKCWNLFCQGSFYVEADYDEYSPGKDGWNFEFLDGSYVISVKSEKSEENEKKNQNNIWNRLLETWPREI